MKAKQWQDIRNMADAEMAAKLNETKEKLFRLKFKHFATPVKNSLEIRGLRRLVARLNTLLKERQLSTSVKSRKK